MLLSNLRQFGEVILDKEFDSLGMATTTYKTESVLSFLVNKKYLADIVENKNIVAVITTREIFETLPLRNGLGVLLSENPKLTFYLIHNYLTEKQFYWEKFENRISMNANISDNCVVGENSIIIGDQSIIENNVTIYPGTEIGKNVIIRSGAIIGSNGFQFLNDGHEVLRVESAGRVIIEDYAEVQHNTCIDRGVFGGATILKEHSKIDNLVHIAHDDVIGKRSLIVAGSSLGGRVIIGDDCWVGINATISNGISIGNNSTVSLGAVVTKNVPDNSTVTGNFAIEHAKFINFIKTIR